MKVKTLMSKQLFALPDTATVEAAAQLMAKESIGLLPVLHKGTLSGVVTDRDLITRCVGVGQVPRDTFLGAIMTKSVVCAAPEETIMEASRKMANHRVRRLPVCRDNQVIGVLSVSDLARRADTGFEAAMAISEIHLP